MKATNTEHETFHSHFFVVVFFLQKYGFREIYTSRKGGEAVMTDEGNVLGPW